MAQLAADFTVTFDLRTRRIYVKDTTAGEPTGNPLKQWKGVITNITSPAGDVIYSNAIAGVADFIYYTPETHVPGGGIIPEKFTPNPTSSTEIAIPELSAGGHQKGLYSISIELQSATDTYTATKTFVFNYEEPNITLSLDYNSITPLFTSEDETDYSQDGYTVTVDRVHTISFPKDGVADHVSTEQRIELSTFYSTTQTATLQSTATWVKGILTVIQEFSAEEEIEVLVVEDLCQIYEYVNAIYEKYVAAEGSNTAHASNIFKDLMIANALLQLIRSAIQCENTDALNGYAERIKEIAEQYGASECGNLNTTPVQITGVFDTTINTVTVAYASDDEGTDYSLTPVEGTHTYIGFYAHNQSDTVGVANFDGLWIKFVGDDGTGGGGDITFDGDRTVTRDGIPNVNVGGVDVVEFLENYFFPAQQPTIIEPTVTISATGNSTHEVGDNYSETVTVTLNAGSIVGKLNSSGVWDASLSQGDRSGAADYIAIEGTEIVLRPTHSGSTTVAMTIAHGANVIDGDVDIAAGIHPKDSTGNNSTVLSPYPATSVSKNLTITGKYKIFYGATASNPSTPAQGRSLPSSVFETNSITLNTGTTHLKFAVLVPSTMAITSIVDLDALNKVITSEYTLLSSSFSMVDALGNPTTNYKLYVKTLGVAYTTNHRHQITIA